MNANYIDRLLSTLKADLYQIKSKESNLIAMHRLLAATSKSYISKLRKHVLSEGFDSIEEEVQFFKVTKPKFSSLVYFHEKIYTLETRMPDGTGQQKSIYLAREIAKIDNFYFNNTEFSAYMKKGSTVNDANYFVVGNGQLTLGLGYEYLDFDPDFGSVYSSLIARFIGAQLALEYINKRLSTIEGFGDPYSTSPSLDYDGTVTELIELAYALQRSGKVKSDIKKIISVFESIFSIPIKDAYRTYYGFKSRKTDRTKFLSFLKKELNNALDQES